MKSVAAALLHLLQLLRLRLLIIRALALPGEITFTCKKGFAEALDSIVATDNRYLRKAYVFLRDPLDYTTKQQKKTKGAAGQTAKKAGFTSQKSGARCWVRTSDFLRVKQALYH